MKRPTLGGKPLPVLTGRCFLCREPLGTPRAGQIQLLAGQFRLTCLDQDGCHARRLQERGATPNG
jgi:hypothetical protein